MQRISIWSVLAALLVMLAGVADLQAKTTVVRKPATVKYHYFDPQNKPADMPQLHRGEAALCRGDFGVAVQLEYSSSTRRDAVRRYVSTIRVSAVNAEVTLQNDIWLPNGASPRLKKHEEGHRQIAEMVYDKIAEKAVRTAAAKLDGKSFVGEGATGKEAREAAEKVLSTAHSAMVQEYLDHTSRAGQKVQELYDEITEHGVKLKVQEEDAIRQAFEQKPPPLWPGAATRPAGTDPQAPADTDLQTPAKPAEPEPRPAVDPRRPATALPD